VTPADDDEYGGDADESERPVRVSFHQDDNSSGDDTISLDLLRDGTLPVDRRSGRAVTAAVAGNPKPPGRRDGDVALRWIALRRSLQPSSADSAAVNGDTLPSTSMTKLLMQQQRDGAGEDGPRDGAVGCGEVGGTGAGGGCSEDTDSDGTPGEFGSGSAHCQRQLTPFQTKMAPRHRAVVRLASVLAAGSTSSLRHPIVTELISNQPSPADGASMSSSPSATSRLRFLFSMRRSRSFGSSVAIHSSSSGPAPAPSTSSVNMTGVQTERKAIKVVGTMFALFVACWASFFIVNLASGVCRSCHIDERVFKSFLWLGYASSTVNPIIYTIFNRSFKRTFVRILTCADWSSSSNS
jgi:hypothetical protein